MKLITFLTGNIRGWAGVDQDGNHAWKMRAPLYASLPGEHSPLIAGFQEFHESNLADLEHALPNHSWTLGREYGERQYVPLVWDTRRFLCRWYIDWPLTRNLRVLSAEILRHRPGEPSVRDHYPVSATVTYAGAAEQQLGATKSVSTGAGSKT